MAVTPAFVFVLNRKVLISDKPKTKRDNAFQYVVLRLANSPAHRTESDGADSGYKITNFRRNEKISLELFAFQRILSRLNKEFRVKDSGSRAIVCFYFLDTGAMAN